MNERMILVDGLPARPAGMSHEQYAYALALAHYGVIQEAMKKGCAGLDSTKDEGNPYIEGSKANKVYTGLRYDEAFNLLVQAEDALIAWADGEFRRSLGKQRYQQIRPVFEQATKKGMKQRLVEICFKFRADGRNA